jgi:hypothetical protein
MLLLLLLPVFVAGKVIKGWDTGVASMKKGELANLVCRWAAVLYSICVDVCRPFICYG